MIPVYEVDFVQCTSQCFDWAIYKHGTDELLGYGYSGSNYIVYDKDGIELPLPIPIKLIDVIE